MIGNIPKSELPRLIIVDLDGVLWEDNISENFGNISINTELVELLKQFNKEGVLISCVSKNNKDVVWVELQKLKIDKLMIFPKICFSPKPPLIQNTLNQVNVASEYAIFIDDTERERKEVERHLPELRCFNSEEAILYLKECLSQNCSSATIECLTRNEHYQREAKRLVQSMSSLVDISSFITSSELTIYLNRIIETDLIRIAELYDRSHRLNFSSHRKDLNTLKEMVVNKDSQVLSVRVVDQYGPYGLVGCVLIKRKNKNLLIEDFILSCRVQGRMVEYAVIKAILLYAKKNKYSTCSLLHKQTKYNNHLEQVLKILTFRKTKHDSEYWVRELNEAKTNSLSGIILPKVIWNSSEIDYDKSGIPFVGKAIVNYFNSNSVQTPILSIGSGYNEVLGNYLNHSHNIIGLDVLPFPGVNIIDNAESLACIANNSIGTVLCIDMMEHTQEPWKVPQAILRVLHKKGVAVFTVPFLLGIHCIKDYWRLTPEGLKQLIINTQCNDTNTKYHVVKFDIEGSIAYPIRSLIIAEKK